MIKNNQKPGQKLFFLSLPDSSVYTIKTHKLRNNAFEKGVMLKIQCFG